MSDEHKKVLDSLPVGIQKIIQDAWNEGQPQRVIDDIRHMATCLDCQNLIREGKLKIQFERTDKIPT